MNRRRLLATFGAGASAAVAAPAIAQSAPEFNWRMVTSFPKNLGVMFGTAELFASMVSELTDGRLRVQLFGPGEIVGGTQVLDATASNTIELTQTAPTYFYGKDPAFAFGSTLPFMINARQQNAWLYYKGGNELLQELYRKHNVYGLPSGNTGTQMGGWFRREVKTPGDLKGLKFRVAGFAGEVLARVGATPQQIPASDIYSALERGTIDGLEYIGPFDDEKLGIVRVAPYYYYPGWHEGGSIIVTLVNFEQWNKLPKRYQRAIEVAAMACNTAMQARFDSENPDALVRLIQAGAQLRSFSPEVLEVLARETNELLKEIATTNDLFRRMLESQTAFRDKSYTYHQIAEYSFDTTMLRLRRQR
ncbi:TRAP transporter substrate-binding protein [Enterovirga sp. CN4-39]|uniref:TRAP transporter substrate-binding protein n=1 Tax=Enterovirga sp. CN4-39 TaxID=3400910 RepID=UPI003C1179AD